MSKSLVAHESVFNDPQPLKVDVEKGIVHEVKVLGLKSKNRREYREDAVRKAAPLYEGAIVHVEHPESVRRHNPPGGVPADSVEDRGLTERFARLAGIHFVEGKGLYAAEMQCDLNHPFTKSFLWWAEKAPEKLALSSVHAGKADLDKGKGIYVFNSIDEVRSVDAVSRGGTTTTLYESESLMNENELFGQYVRSLFPESVALDNVKAAITAAVKRVAEIPADFKGTVAEAMGALKTTSDPRVRLVVESLDKMLVAQEAAEKRAKAKQACADAKLPEHAISDVFLESLTREAEENWKASIEDRRKLCDEKPSNPPRTLGGDVGVINFETFIANVKAGQ